VIPRLCFALVAWLLSLTVARADDVYIWQRLWTPELTRALADQGPEFTALRVLGAQYLGAEPARLNKPNKARWAEPNLNFAALRALNKPLILVLRLPGSAPLLAPLELHQQITRVRSSWLSGGVTVARVELDFDCAVSKLADYRIQLLALRQLLGKELALDITALPAWLKAAELPALLAVVDRVTLQVHSVLAPKRGLFDPRLAEFWIRQLANISTKPFFVALPAYGAKLLLDAEGQVIGVEHEAELASAHSSEIELQANPQSVRALIDSLAARPVAKLAGFVWFRLPLQSDVHAWAPATLRALIKKQILRAQLQPEFLRNGTGGFDVRLVSVGTLPGSLPLRLAVNKKCSGAAVGNYLFANGVFSALSSQELKPGNARVIGWLRCPDGETPKIVRP
jgi:hypothetical protein